MKKIYHNELVDVDFYLQLNDQFRLTTVLVVYRMPDYFSILNEFLWQTLDKPPEYPRISRFIDYWKENLDAPIHSIKIASTEVISPANFKSVSKIYNIKT